MAVSEIRIINFDGATGEAFVEAITDDGMHLQLTYKRTYRFNDYPEVMLYSRRLLDRDFDMLTEADVSKIVRYVQERTEPYLYH